MTVNECVARVKLGYVNLEWLSVISADPSTKKAMMFRLDGQISTKLLHMMLSSKLFLRRVVTLLEKDLKVTLV